MKYNKLGEIEIKILKIARTIKEIQNKKIDFSSIFDSLEMLEFIEKLENKFNIKLDYKSINKKNFSSKQNLSKLINKIEKK
tara:strand:+ start:419 stop:661 length:243 start_codon:yes stop_codon:yes gene_type:complete